jgi:hypothetical protein
MALDMHMTRPINIAGEAYNLSDLSKIPADYYGEVFGEDFQSAITADNGMADADKLEMMIETLPMPEKNILNRYLKQYFANEHRDD